MPEINVPNKTNQPFSQIPWTDKTNQTKLPNITTIFKAANPLPNVQLLNTTKKASNNEITPQEKTKHCSALKPVND